MNIKKTNYILDLAITKGREIFYSRIFVGEYVLLYIYNHFFSRENYYITITGG